MVAGLWARLTPLRCAELKTSLIASRASGRVSYSDQRSFIELYAHLS